MISNGRLQIKLEVNSVSVGIYFDNASTSFPKPSIINDTIEGYLRDAGCSPGRSGHARARRSESLVNKARQQVATCWEWIIILKYPTPITPPMPSIWSLRVA